MDAISFGFARQPRVYVGDSIDLEAEIFADQEFKDEENPVPIADIHVVTFYIQRPQDAPGTYVLDPVTLTPGIRSGVVIDNGRATVKVDPNVNNSPGQYHAIAQFQFGGDPQDSSTWKTRSVIADYDVADPFERSGADPSDPAIDMAWGRFEDLFDSEDGGPWLRDMTLGRFDKTRLRTFIPDVFFDINAQMPQTNYDPATFNYGKWDGQAVVAQGILVHTVRHLMRSYTEQPDILNSPVGYADRKRYLDAWSALYNMELERYKAMLELFKRRLFDQGTRTLVSSKSGRGIYGPMRQRGIWRGYYLIPLLPLLGHLLGASSKIVM